MSSSSPVCCFSEAYMCFCGKVPVPEVVESELFSDEEEAEEELLEADAVEAWSHHLVSFLLLSFSVRGVSVCVRFHTRYSVLLYLLFNILMCTCSMFIEIEYSMSITSTVITIIWYYFGILQIILLFTYRYSGYVQYILQWYICLHYLFVYISVYHINGKLDLDHIDVVFDRIVWHVFTYF